TWGSVQRSEVRIPQGTGAGAVRRNGAWGNLCFEILLRLGSADFQRVSLAQIQEGEHSFVGRIACKRCPQASRIGVAGNLSPSLRVRDYDRLALAFFAPERNRKLVSGHMKPAGRRAWQRSSNLERLHNLAARCNHID